MKKIIQKIKYGGRIFLFLDYDGTLVPIQNSPERAVLHPSKKRFLKQLSKRLFLCIVSGRSLTEVRRLVAIKDIAYIGNHGLEISYKRRHWIHPDAKKSNPVRKDVLKNIRRSTKAFPGVLIEDKGVTGTIHYRLLNRALWKPLKEIVTKEVGLRNRQLRLTEGKRVLEIRPNIRWDKGKGIQELIGWLTLKESPFCVYVGDDRTDEDAFKALKKLDRNAMTILVGQRKYTHASYRVANVSRVWTFLRLCLTSAKFGQGLISPKL